MAVTSESSAPYAPGTAITAIIERYREKGMTTPFTAEVLQRAGVSESLTPRTLQSLQVLDLIDEEGKPTDTLEAIRVAPTNEYTSRLSEWVRTAYADVFSFVDPATDGESNIRDAFRTYKPLGQQDRMVSLFLSLCAFAGIVEEPPKKEPKPRAPRAKRKVSKIQRKPAAQRGQQNTPPPIKGLPPAVKGLIESLPSPDVGWTKEQRDKFVSTFEAVLDFSYPIRSEALELQKPDEQEDDED